MSETVQWLNGAAAMGAALVLAGCDIQFHPIGGQAASAASTETVVVQSPADDVTSFACAVAPPALSGVAEPGTACTAASDCGATCCDCGTGTTSWLSATCLAGTCAPPDVTCGRTIAAYCAAPATPTPLPACGGLTYDTAECEACAHASCCTEAEECANGACDALDACIAASCAGDCG